MRSDAGQTIEYRLDVEDILCRLQSDWILLADLCEILVEEMPGMLGRIRQAVEAGNAEEIHRAAHYLKGSVGIFGEGHHSEVARRLEQAGRENRLEEADTTFRELEECMKEFVGAVAALEEKAHDRSDSRR